MRVLYVNLIIYDCIIIKIENGILLNYRCNQLDCVYVCARSVCERKREREHVFLYVYGMV